MGFGLRILVSILVVFLLIQTLNATSSSSVLRRPLARNKNRQIPPNCTHLVSESQCSQNPQCRWCKSQSLDDTCFTRSEAWRLPLQDDTDLTVATIQQSGSFSIGSGYLQVCASRCAQDKGCTGGTTSDAIIKQMHTCAML